MFMLGVFWGADSAPSALVLLAQTLKNLRRHYRVETVVETLPGLQIDALATRVGEVFEDRRYACYKRVFSQDRRPAKRIKVKPRIVLSPAVDSAEAADYLRSRQLPVACVICRDQMEWQRIDHHRICLEHNYLVSPRALADCLAAVEAENRLCFMAGAFETAAQIAALRTAVPYSAGWPPGGIALALAAAVWFRETVKSLKRYGQAG
ncbi:MAG: hypothetical protein R6X05_14525 [Desulfobacterales bacterium]